MQLHRSRTVAALAIATAAAINADPNTNHTARSIIGQRFANAGYPEAECEALAAEAVEFACQTGISADAVVDGLIATWHQTRSRELSASLRESKWFARDAEAFMDALREPMSRTIDSGALGEALAKDAAQRVRTTPWQLSGIRAGRRNRLRGRA